MLKKEFLLAASAMMLVAACGGEPATNAADEGQTTVEAAGDMVGDAVDAAETMVDEMTAGAKLAAVLAAQPDAVKARYDARHPAETIAFFGVEPGMTVVEALPGGGWYSKILLPYLGERGKLIGADYSLDMWPLFGGFATEEYIEKKKTWVADWTAEAEGWRGEGDASVSAFVLGSLPEDMKGTADAVLFVRALHNLNSFEGEGGFRTAAIADAYAALKPGGTVGVVQHRAPEGNSDEWADGSNGYLKQSALISAFENAGFVLVDTSEINANPSDQPTEEDMVWRLPPTLGTSGDDEEMKAKMTAIGESDRMTLKFRKPE